MIVIRSFIFWFFILFVPVICADTVSSSFEQCFLEKMLPFLVPNPIVVKVGITCSDSFLFVLKNFSQSSLYLAGNQLNKDLLLKQFEGARVALRSDLSSVYSADIPVVDFVWVERGQHDFDAIFPLLQKAQGVCFEGQFSSSEYRDLQNLMRSMNFVLINTNELENYSKNTQFLFMKNDIKQNFLNNFIRKNDVVFDVGAHVGSRTSLYLSWGASVICVEPQPECCDILRRKFSQQNVQIIPKGLAAQEGTLRFFISSKSNTISTFSTEWCECSRFSKDHAWDKTISIPVVTLDHLIHEYGIPKFCKIDVENFEKEVLRGLSKCIPCISFEFAIETIHNTKACLNLLSDLGYKHFNFCNGEDPAIVLDEWGDASHILNEILVFADKTPLLWGDIYVRCN